MAQKMPSTAYCTHDGGYQGIQHQVSVAGPQHGRAQLAHLHVDALCVHEHPSAGRLHEANQ
jgi:hypothetical protein